MNLPPDRERQLQTEQPGPDTSDLERQAKELRTRVLEESTPRPGGYSLVRKAIYLVVVLGSVFLSVFLLVMTDTRRGWIESATGGVFSRLAEDRLYRLPAPPPKAAGTTRVPEFSVTVGDDEDFILYSSPETTPTRPTDSRLADQPSFVAPLRTPAAEKAFESLKEVEEVVGRLVANEIEEYRFVDWRPVKSEPPIFWIDLIAEIPGQSGEVHLIWEINLQTETATALSQQARDLTTR